MDFFDKFWTERTPVMKGLILFGFGVLIGGLLF